MDRRYFKTAALAAVLTCFTLNAALAQRPDPTVPEDANDEQTMIPEDADDGDVLAPEDAVDTPDTAAESPAPSVSTTPEAAPLRQAEAPAASPLSSPMNVLILSGDARPDDALRGGCWIRLHESPSFAGNTVTIMGPANLSELRGPFDMDWEDQIGSLEVGPSAAVSIFSDGDFEGTETPFGSRRRVADLPGEFESLRITCSARG
jgi:hypothetical protein